MLSSDDVIKISNGLYGELPPYVLITGGEPLIVPWIKSIVTHLVEQNVRVALCTNGVLIARHKEWIAELLDEVFISVWGVAPISQNQLRGKDSWERMVDGVKALVRFTKRPRIIFRWTVMPENIAYLVGFPSLAVGLNIDGISIQPADIKTNAFGPKDTHPVWRPNIISKLNIVESINSFYRHACSFGILEQDAYSRQRTLDYILAACGYGEFSYVSCNAPRRSLVIDPNMRVKPCYFIPAIGNIKSQDLSEFRSSTYSQWLADFSTRTQIECRTCVCPRNYKKFDD